MCRANDSNNNNLAMVHIFLFAWQKKKQHKRNGPVTLVWLIELFIIYVSEKDWMQMTMRKQKQNKDISQIIATTVSFALVPWWSIECATLLLFEKERKIRSSNGTIDMLIRTKKTYDSLCTTSVTTTAYFIDLLAKREENSSRCLEDEMHDCIDPHRILVVSLLTNMHT